MPFFPVDPSTLQRCAKQPLWIYVWLVYDCIDLDCFMLSKSIGSDLMVVPKLSQVVIILLRSLNQVESLTVASKFPALSLVL